MVTTELLKLKMMKIKEIKKKHSLTDDDLAEMFSYKSKAAYANSSAKARIEKGLERFYELTTQEGGSFKN